MQPIYVPLFCLTSDQDWASDYCLRDFLGLLAKYGVKPTVFATNKSMVLEEHQRGGAIEVGIHPNFRINSTHGRDTVSVIDHLLHEFPAAEAFRSHAFIDSSEIVEAMVARGIRYDSNLCLYLQPHITPLRLWSGLIRLPVFWEDDAHWLNAPGDWDFEKHAHEFYSPGLKILNFHPFFVAANIPNQDYYRDVKKHITTLTSENVDHIRYKGKGTRTFLIEFLESLAARRERSYTLSELYNMFPQSGLAIQKDETAGRQTRLSDEDHRRYWQLRDEEKQEFIKNAFQQRNAKDRYATSRDYNLRELEIDSIKKNLRNHGKLVDLGAGNGYTALSIAREFGQLEIVAIDFSENLIAGARDLSREMQSELLCHPRFVCADAIKYISECRDDSVDSVLTERFLQNMPSEDVQHKIIREAWRVLRRGGRLLMCEGSEDGFERLNDLREAVGLSRIAATSADNVSAIRFKDREIETFAEGLGFALVNKVGYSTFFEIARVLHPLLVHPQNPRFDSPINDLARRIQLHARQEPGYGSNVLWVFEKKQAATV